MTPRGPRLWPSTASTWAAGQRTRRILCGSDVARPPAPSVRRPLKLFSWIASALLLLASAPSVFLAIHYISTGRLSPHKWAGFTAGSIVMLASLSLVLGFILEVFARMRMNQESILAELRRRRD